MSTFAKALERSLAPETRRQFQSPVANGWKIETTTDTFYLPTGSSMRQVGKYDIGIFQFRSADTTISIKTSQVRSISNLRSGTAHALTPLSKFADLRRATASTTRGTRHWEFVPCNQSMGRDFWDDEWNFLCVCPDGSYAPLGGVCQIWVDDWGGAGGGYGGCDFDPIACLLGGETDIRLPGAKRITVFEYLYCRIFGNLYPYHAILEKHADGSGICLNDNTNSNGEYPMYYGFGGCPQYTTLVQYGDGKLLDSNDYNHVYQSNFTWSEDFGGCDIHTGNLV